MPRKACLALAWILALILLVPRPASGLARPASEPLLPNLSFTRIIAGGHHACALTAAGAVWCWGMNDNGQLGNGANNNRSIPAAVVGLPGGMTRLAAGRAHTCALTAAGGVKCWGANESGQLGDGTTNDHNTPVDVTGLSSGVIALAADGGHTCALLAGGGLKCWGWNIYGQIGDGTRDNRLTPVGVSGLDSGVSAAAAGEGFTCAIVTGGGMKCWGANYYGQLGDGTNQDHWVPMDVIGLGGSTSAVSAGGYHTCAIMASGGVKCWGENYLGQLGNGSTTDSYTPVEVVGLPGGEAMLEAGNAHTCVWAADGRVKCWGSNASGLLGTGDTTNSSIPQAVSGLLGGFISLSAGWDHTCVVTAGGQARCWGANGFGQLGDGSIIQRSTPVEVRLLASGAQKLAAGYYHTCAITAAGGVNCWGRNWSGQLGDGSEGIASGLPVQVVGLASGASAVSAGEGHTCALTTSGGVKCWGSNNFGQLGNGTTENSNIPVQVTGLESGVSAIEAGGDTCALTSTGGVKCWGSYHGTTPVDMVGLSSGVAAISGNSQTCALLASGGVKCWGFGSYTTPVDIPGLESGVSAVSVGQYHACALMASGGVKCWGDNEHGQLGCGDVGCGIAGGLVDVAGLPGEVLALSAGARHTCVLLAGGRMMCWGRDVDGELGDGLTTDAYVPVDVKGLASGVTEIALMNHTCAIAAGRAKCWGPDSLGQLGQGSNGYQLTPVEVVTGAGEHLRLSYDYGLPGSMFTVTGWNLPPSSAITLTLNSAVLTTTLATTSTGSFTVFLDTTGADPGYYVLRVQSTPSAAASFVLRAGFPLRPREGGGLALSAPPGLGVPAYWLYLPVALKK